MSCSSGEGEVAAEAASNIRSLVYAWARAVSARTEASSAEVWAASLDCDASEAARCASAM